MQIKSDAKFLKTISVQSKTASKIDYYKEKLEAHNFYPNDPVKNEQAREEAKKIFKDQEFPIGLTKPLNNFFLSLPTSMLKHILGCSFALGISQMIQEFFMQFLPKVLINGLLVRQSLAAIIDEAGLEFPEYPTIYLVGTLIASQASKLFASHLGIENHHLLSHRMYELHQNLNTEFETGVLSKQRVRLTENLLHKTALAKLLNFTLTTGVVCALEVCVPSFRTLLTQWIFKTNNFYKISGLPTTAEEDNDGQKAVDQSWANIKGSLGFIAAFVPAIFGLAWVLGKKIKNQNNFSAPRLLRLSKNLDMGEKYGLSKTFISFCMATAIYAYLSVARNLAEFQEILGRIVFFSIPSVLAYKQVSGNGFAYANAKLMGIEENILSSPKTYWKEAWGEEAGKRDIFDLNLVDLHFDRKTGLASGSVNELPSVQKLKETNPAKYEKFIKRTMFLKSDAPLFAALGVGCLINFANFLVTQNLREKELAGKKANNTTTNNKTDNSNSLLTAFTGLTTMKTQKPSLSLTF